MSRVPRRGAVIAQPTPARDSSVPVSAVAAETWTSASRPGGAKQHQAEQQRREGQHPQRPDHRQGDRVRALLTVGGLSRVRAGAPGGLRVGPPGLVADSRRGHGVAHRDHRPGPAGVDPGDDRRRQAADEHDRGRPAAVDDRLVLGRRQHGLLGPEAGERRDPGEAEQADGQHHRDAAVAAPEPAHVGELRRARDVGDAPRHEEEQGLAAGVGEQVEHPWCGTGGLVGDGDAGEHVGDLADRGVGQQALEVVLADGGDRRPEHRDRGHHGGDVQSGSAAVLGVQVQGEEAGHQVDPGRHHRRRVDQRRDRGRALHGVGQPGVQRELGGLARDPGEQQQRGRDDGRHRQRAGGSHRREAADGRRPRAGQQHQDGDEHAEVTDARHEERLHRRPCARCPARSGGPRAGRRRCP